MPRLILAAALLSASTGCALLGDSESTIPCSEDLVEVWRVSVRGDGPLRVAVDTISAETTFDPAIYVLAVEDWSSDAAEVTFSELLADGDDDFECTFPPEDYECPQVVTVASGEDVAVVVEVVGECAGANAGYTLIADLGGDALRVRSLGVTDVDTLDANFLGGPENDGDTTDSDEGGGDGDSGM